VLRQLFFDRREIDHRMARKYLVGLVLLLSCSWSMASDALRVGMSADYPPLAFKQEGRIVGIEADNARVVGEIIGRSMQLVDMPLRNSFPPCWQVKSMSSCPG
jgi:ABC-type amino acid transport substrate-binding protein